MADYSISAELELDTSGYTKTIEEAEKQTKTFKQKVEELSDKINKNGLIKAMANLDLATNTIKKAFSSVTKVIKDVSKAVKECTDAYKVQKSAEVALETSAKNNPFLNSSSIQALKEYASEMQRISTTGDEQILPYMAQLASAGRTQEEIQKIVKTALDVSASGAMSFDSAITQLNATFSGNIGLMGRQISELKNLSKEQLKNGDAIDIVAGKYAGIAEATAKATGSTEQLQNAIGDLKEALGANFEKQLSPFRTYVKGIVEDLTEAINKRRILSEAREAQDAGVSDLEQKRILYQQTQEEIETTRQGIEHLYDDVAENALKARMTEEQYSHILENTKKLSEEKLKNLQEYSATLSAEISAMQREEYYTQLAKEASDAEAKAEAERIAKQEEANRIALEAKRIYAETLVNFEKEIELRRETGEEIAEEQYTQEKINTVKNAFIQMIKDGQGYITKENQGYKDALSLLSELQAQEKSISDEKEFQNWLAKSHLEIEKEVSEVLQKTKEEAGKKRLENYLAPMNEARSAVEYYQEAFKIAEEKADSFKAKMNEIGTTIKNVLSGTVSFIKSAISTSISLISKAINFSISDAEETLLAFEDKLISFFKYTVPKLPEYFKKAFSSLKKIIGGNYQTWIAEGLEILKTLFTDLINGLSEFVTGGGFKTLVTFFIDTITSLIDWLSKNIGELTAILVEMTTIIVTEVFKNLPQIIVSVLRAIPEILSGIAKAIGTMIAEAVTSIGTAIGKGWNSFKKWLGFATGVNNAPRGLALVGEQGPELIDFRGGERVYTAGNTKQILGGGGSSNSFNVTFNNIQDTSASAMMRELRRYNRELAINGVI